MLIQATNLLGTPILSMQAAGQIGYVENYIIDPKTLKIIAFITSGPGINRNANILDVRSIREYSSMGMVIDSDDEFVEKNDVIKISEVIDLNFTLPGLKVETKKGTKLGHISDFTVTDNDFMVQQLIVKRPSIKGFIDPELTIPRNEIVEITDYKIIVKSEEKTIKKHAEENFVPNFVNPFRKTENIHATNLEEK